MMACAVDVDELTALYVGASVGPQSLSARSASRRAAQPQMRQRAVRDERQRGLDLLISPPTVHPPVP